MDPIRLKTKIGSKTIICDTDACSDVDDFLALAYLIKAAPQRLKLVSTTYGPVELRSKAVRTLFKSMNYDTEIVLGAKELLTKDTPVWMAGNESYYFNPVSEPTNDNLLEAYLRHDDFTVLALGPLTNIAILLQSAEFRKKCSRIVIMGGAIHPDQNVPFVEHNFKGDPVATKIVMESDIPKILIPVDLTVVHPMTQHYQDLFSTNASDYGRLLSTWINIWRTTTLKFDAPFYDSVHWHDPIAAAFLFHPELFTTETMHFDVDENGGLINGGSNVTLVCTHMDPRVIDLIANMILGSEPSTERLMTVS
jgi:purine nucleosidase